MGGTMSYKILFAAALLLFATGPAHAQSCDPSDPMCVLSGLNDTLQGLGNQVSTTGTQMTGAVNGFTNQMATSTTQLTTAANNINTTANAFLPRIDQFQKMSQSAINQFSSIGNTFNANFATLNTNLANATNTANHFSDMLKSEMDKGMSMAKEAAKPANIMKDAAAAGFGAAAGGVFGALAAHAVIDVGKRLLELAHIHDFHKSQKDADAQAYQTALKGYTEQVKSNTELESSVKGFVTLLKTDNGLIFKGKTNKDVLVKLAELEENLQASYDEQTPELQAASQKVKAAQDQLAAAKSAEEQVAAQKALAEAQAGKNVAIHARAVYKTEKKSWTDFENRVGSLSGDELCGNLRTSVQILIGTEGDLRNARVGLLYGAKEHQEYLRKAETQSFKETKKVAGSGNSLEKSTNKTFKHNFDELSHQLSQDSKKLESACRDAIKNAGIDRSTFQGSLVILGKTVQGSKVKDKLKDFCYEYSFAGVDKKKGSASFYYGGGADELVAKLPASVTSQKDALKHEVDDYNKSLTEAATSSTALDQAIKSASSEGGVGVNPLEQTEVLIKNQDELTAMFKAVEQEPQHKRMETLLGERDAIDTACAKIETKPLVASAAPASQPASALSSK
jgi:hypothetical protein